MTLKLALLLVTSVVALPGYGSPLTSPFTPVTITHPTITPGLSLQSSTAKTAAATTSFTFSCDSNYCENSTSYCIYWAGSTSFDFSKMKPVPGETRTSLGTCGSTTVLGPNTTTGSLSSAAAPSTANGSSSLVTLVTRSSVHD